ncbi:putative beta-D-galactosidase [Paenibacillus terrae HPL-003]|uniref:Putative beta-D-galactosidase n=1 Tax=Paenibacillus terrae (strain HPL-003) TaxID=985665 RepID=G7VV24_PAETH|nr:YhcH/YjgK/YiaL family protein [Paenibacillus terrae]AET58793.1 putative beta-D-galactosidase [Paenibacillus terrae HPL-003]
MIVATLEQEERYRHIHPQFMQAFLFLQQTSQAELAEGKYEIDGQQVYALVQEYDTKPEAECGWESHREYIDIQYIVSGREQINYAPLNQLTGGSDYVADKDKINYESSVSPGSSLQLGAGQFAVFFPEDGHQACIRSGQTEHVKKMVIKVKI